MRALQEIPRRIVQSERREIKPRDVRALRARVAHRGEPSAHLVVDHVEVTLQIPEHAVQPCGAAVVGGDRGHRADRGGLVLGHLRVADPHVHVRRIRENHLRAFRARDVERLRRARRRERLHRRAFVDRGERHVTGVAVDERRVDLVGEDAHVIPVREFGQAQHLVARQHLADRVVRVAQHERVAPARERALDRVEIEQPSRVDALAVAQHRHLDHVDAAQSRHAQERHVRGRRHDDRMTFADDFAEEHLIRLHHIRHGANDGRIHGPVIAQLPCGARARHLALQRVGQISGRAAGRRVGDRARDARRETEVHFRDERADRAGEARPFVRADAHEVVGRQRVDRRRIEVRGGVADGGGVVVVKHGAVRSHGTHCPRAARAVQRRGATKS